MGKIIQIDNGVKTIYVNGQDISSLSADTGTYYVGVDLSSGSYEKLNPNGTIVNLEAGSITDTTYTDIVSMISSNGLTPSTYYNITDFETIYDQPDYFVDGVAKTVVTTKTSSNEPLIVLAVSTSGISKQVFQVNKPNNKVQYDVTFSSTEVNGSPAKGRISELIDENNNRTDYDHTNIDFKRYQNYERNVQLTGTILDYDCTTGLVVGSGTLFLTDVVPGDILLLDTFLSLGYNVGVKVVSISDDTNLYVYVDAYYSGTAFSSENYDFYNSNATGYYNRYKEIYVAQSDESDYLEYTTFQNTLLVSNNYIGDFAKFKVTYGYPFLLTNNVFGVSTSFTVFFNKIGDLSYNNHIAGYDGNLINNIISDGFTQNFAEIGSLNIDANKIGYNFIKNVINNDFTSNVIGNECSDNQTQSFISNTVGDYFAGNSLGIFESNFIGNHFQYNTIGNGGRFNNIGNYAQYNTIGVNFRDNKIGNVFQYNTIGEYFQSNQIGDFFGNSAGGVTNIIFDYFRYNKIGNFFGNDTNFPSIGGGFGSDGGNMTNSYFQFNDIGDNFLWNIIDSNFNYNKIGTDFWINIFGQSNTHNTIGDLFVGNDIYDSFVSNQIGNYTPYNVISANFTNNKIGDFFGNAGVGTQNNIGNNFQNNIIGNYFGDDGTHTAGGNTIIDDFMLNTVQTDTLYGVNFSASTHVYANYNCTVFKRDDGLNRISYFSGDTLTINDVNT